VGDILGIKLKMRATRVTPHFSQTVAQLLTIASKITQLFGKEQKLQFLPVLRECIYVQGKL